MLSKESKIGVLENFYGIDYVLLGKPVGKIQNCCPVVKEEYISIKGALLSVFVEMLRLMDHSPKSLKEQIDSTALKGIAKENAKTSRLASQKIVKTENARRDIKAELKEALTENKNVDVTTLVESKIREKAFRLALDHLLIARALNEAKNLEGLNDWTGKVVEDSYKILRDSLCETAMMLLDDEEPKDN
jgi:uncharacterized protein YaiL (DUF2058 family)